MRVLSILETLLAGFEQEKEPRVIDALYDAAKNKRLIEHETDILPNGTYRYKNLGGDSTVFDTDYLPVPVSINPMAVLDEIGQEASRLTLSYDPKKNLWSANCALINTQHLRAFVRHTERNQALARAVMCVVCLKLAYADRENE